MKYLVPLFLITATVLGAQTPVKLKVGVLPYVSSAVLKIAVDEGFFREQGLDVELVLFRTSTDVVAPLIKGDLDAATPSMNPGLFNAIGQGAPMRIALPLTITTVASDTNNAFVVRKKDFADGKYAAAASWKGARIVLAGNRFNGQGYALARLLQSAGLTFGDTKLSTLDFAVQADALLSGQVDIVLAGEPWLSRMLAREGISLLRPVEPLTPNFVLSTVVFGARLLNDQALGTRFATAVEKANQQYRKGKTPRNVRIIAEFTGLDEDTVREIRWSDSSQDGTFDPASIVEYQVWLKQQGVLERVLPPQEFVLRK